MMGQPTELHLKYRPQKLSEVVGQPEAVAILKKMLEEKKVPHALSFTGASGTGKTTLARIIAKRLGCQSSDLQEVNAAEARGIDTIREIQQRMGLAPLGGGCRVWIIDECHRLTGDSQSALLKTLEDTPRHVYFMLATTDPNRLLLTIRNRCTHIPVASLSIGTLKKLITDVATKEGIEELDDEVTHLIAEVADGSARMALNLLGKVLCLETKEEQLEAIQKSDIRRSSQQLVKLLLDKTTKWKDIAAIVKNVEESEAESIRRGVLAYATVVVLNSGSSNARAISIINAFRDHYFDMGKSGLVLSCTQVFYEK